MKAAVLGCGPAGLIAAHAFPGEVEIYSLKNKSTMFGAQYLHSPIPDITRTAPHTISYRLMGDIEGYRYKVYGLDDVEVSPETLSSTHQAWDIREVYEQLWARYSDVINPVHVTPRMVEWLNARRDIDYVISTVPRQLLCFGNHNFAAATIWAAGDAPELGIWVGKHVPECDWVHADEVVCSGLRWHDWYRISSIFGHATVEWPLGPQATKPVPRASLVRKPLWHDCSCWAGTKVLPVGRYGEWKKGVLVSDVYTQVRALGDAA